MIDFSKQFAVIAKLKSLVKIPSGFRGNKGEKSQITEAVARKIQKSSYEKLHKERTETYTPPYKIIAEQLQSPNNQIFKAAVFNLVNIAVNRKNYKKEILNILEKTAEDKNLSTEQSEYIKSKIEKLKQL